MTKATSTTTDGYRAMRGRHQKEYDSLFSELKPLVFYAFGNKQFDEALDKYLKAGGDQSQLVAALGGLYGQEDKIDELFALSERHGRELRDALKGDKAFAIEAIEYEMDNHEYGWSQEDETVLESLGLATDDLAGEFADWFDEARSAYLESVADYVW